MAWWQEVVFYQIYPRSFADANGDGIGDLRGIINKLDYLQHLGVRALWLSPHYPSPQIDVGYDISDYSAVNPEYGTLDDFRELLAQAHQRGMYIVIDFVLNHTSYLHKWFLESQSSTDHPKRNWYVWHKGKEGNPPNNWESLFGGSAWTLDEKTGEYYYHFFLKEQPDLNWRNPEVQQAMFDAVRFWLELGVDGLRLDAIDTIFEDPTLANYESRYNALDKLKANWLGRELAGQRPDQAEVDKVMEHQCNLPELHGLLQDLRQLVEAYPNRFVVGEAVDIGFLGDGTNQLHAVFNWDFLNEKRLRPNLIRSSQVRWLQAVPQGAWHSNTLNNHDQSRVMTHFGDGVHDVALAKLSAATVVLLEGLPFLYYGEEIGMEDYAVQSYDEVRDMVSSVYRDLMRQEGKSDETILGELAVFSRDRCRTPMQWSAAANAGFSPDGVATWLPVHNSYQRGVNVAAQEADPSSLLNFYRALLHCRNASHALQYGAYRSLDVGQDAYLAFLRESARETCLVLMNFSEEAATVAHEATGTVLLSTHGRAGQLASGGLALAPFEIVVLKM